MPLSLKFQNILEKNIPIVFELSGDVREQLYCALSEIHFEEYLIIDTAPMLNRLERIKGFIDVLSDRGVKLLIAERKLTILQIVSLPEAALKALCDPSIQILVNQKLLSISRLSSTASGAMYEPYVQKLIAEGQLSLLQLFELPYETVEALFDLDIQGMIDKKFLSLPQLFAIPRDRVWAIGDRMIGELLISGVLTITQFLELPIPLVDALCNEGVTELINKNLLTIPELLALSEEVAFMLSDDLVQRLITAKLLTIPQLILLVNHNAHPLLINNQIVAHLMNGDITIEAIIAHLAHPDINNQHHTHTASVHQSVSASAIKLFECYGAQLAETTLDKVIEKVNYHIQNLPTGCKKNEAAKRCISRIVNPNYDFIDICSELTIRKLVGLIYLAIHDEDKRMGSLEAAYGQFVEGLYEIQRGYNLLAKDNHDDGPDAVICASGTFNKLIEKLQGIHPACEIRFITVGTASLKLPIIVSEEVHSYLSSLSHPKTAEQFVETIQLLEKIIKEGITEIWDYVKENISMRVFSEFSDLYKHRNDPEFLEFIETGQSVDVDNLGKYQKQLNLSKGYRLYCGKLAQHSSLFFSSSKYVEFLSQGRHDNSKTQREYDKFFGLTIRHSFLL